ncbi:MAG TPA: hypothetical protein P5137_00045 [Candidatus Brocadiia bacterium]|nr:hypothetical protein [Candidatus Brocadiia bacterium]
MTKRDPGNAYADSVLRRIDPMVMATLAPAQRSALREAISGAQPETKHKVDIRGIIPLFFIRLYFVFLMGRDRRSRAAKTEFDRRKKGQTMSNAYVDSVMRRIDPMILATLTPTQSAALREAIGGAQPRTQHMVDFRGVLPLIVTRLYFVFLVGRDRRGRTSMAEFERRQKSKAVMAALFISWGLICCLLILAGVFYVLKTWAGVDVVQDVHMQDVLTK